MYVCMYVHVCVHVSVYVYVHVHLYIYMYMYMYIVYTDEIGSLPSLDHPKPRLTPACMEFTDQAALSPWSPLGLARWGTVGLWSFLMA